MQLQVKSEELSTRWLAATDAFGTLQRGEYQQAVAVFGEWILLQPTNAYPYILRGVAYQRMGEKDLAEADFRKASVLSSRETAIILREIRAQEKKSRSKE